MNNSENQIHDHNDPEVRRGRFAPINAKDLAPELTQESANKDIEPVPESISNPIIIAAQAAPSLSQEHEDKLSLMTTYWLTTPDLTHRSFSIKWRKMQEGQPTQYGTFKDERTVILNRLFKSGKKKHSATEAEFKAIMRELQEKERFQRGEARVHEANQHLLTNYIKKRYSSRFSEKANKDPRSAINESERAIEAVGEISLISGTAEQIMDSVLEFSNERIANFNRYINRLRGILRANSLHNKADELITLREPPCDVSYITYKQLPILVAHIRSLGLSTIAGVSTETFVSLVQCNFWSGLRIGESVATGQSFLEPDGRALHVHWQIDGRGVKRLPKYDKRRKAHISKQGLVYFHAWVTAPDRDKLDRKQATKKLKEFCKAVFSDPVNHITLHGLRHSYAMVMLRHFEGKGGKRFTLDDVADFLGDHPWTAKKYYAGFVPDKLAFERAMEITDNELVCD